MRRLPRIIPVVLAAALAALVYAVASGVAVATPVNAKGLPDLRERVRVAAQGYDVTDIADYHRRANQYMGECMQSAGFQYVAHTPPTDPRLSLGLTEAQFTQRYGFGISTLIDHPASGQRTDPNLAVEALLDPARQRAYAKARGACEQRRDDAVGDPPGVMRGPAAEGAELTRVSDQANADPRIAAAKDEYARCMTGKGFTVRSGEDLSGPIHLQVEPYRQAFDTLVAEYTASGRDVAVLRVADVLDEGQLARLRHIQQAELQGAAADGACGRWLYPVAQVVHREYLDRYLAGKE
ncbi:hypothetical protein DLJ58_29020 [Micromonospora arida]|uniref:Uncharacterized protein n=1 Tax=Micromonospora arida TaxID=2203715 RepID=A0A3N9X921_9ACTN|nr:hypothetical protein DLJ58_29020 [Micromonospora arida]